MKKENIDSLKNKTQTNNLFIDFSLFKKYYTFEHLK